jgi:hypothetical protein
MAYSTVKKWAALFKADRESVEDDERSVRLKTVVNEDKVKPLEDFIIRDRRVSMRHIAAAMDLSVGSAETIIHKRLHMSKVSARCCGCPACSHPSKDEFEKKHPSNYCASSMKIPKPF